MTDPSPIRVVLVDDQQLFREGVAIMIDAQPDMEVVGRASDGQESLEVIAASEPDVVLMDIRMPVMDGVAATRELFSPVATAARTKPLKVVVLTTFNLDLSAATAIRLGASGFLLKDSTPEFLAASIRAVHSGASVIAPSALSELFSTRTDGRAPAAEVPASFATLSTRERAIFDLAARGRSNGEIADELFVSNHTVKSHISSILTKRDLRDRVQLVDFAHEYGVLQQ